VKGGRTRKRKSKSNCRGCAWIEIRRWAPRELQEGKESQQAQYVFGQDSISGEARCWACTKFATATTISADKYPGRDRQKVTAADVQRVAKTYLVATNMTEGVLIPTRGLPPGGGGLAVGVAMEAGKSAQWIIVQPSR